MKPKLTITLLVLGVALLVFSYYFVFHFPSQMASGQRSQASSEGVRARLKLRAQNLASNGAPGGAGAGTVFVTNKFHWSQLESADYREYIDKLRSVGCPEPTIRDIVITDIMRLYAARRGQFYQNGREFKFWETNEKRKLKAKQIEEREKQLSAIDKEIPTVLRELLGINYEREVNKYFVDTNEDERRLDFLDPEKRRRVLILRDEMEGQRERILGRAVDGQLSAEDQAALQALDAQRQEKLAAFLGEGELEEFELRTSETAERLREELIGFHPTEEEFRQIYALQKALPGAGEEDRAAVEDRIRALLGEARYDEFDRARNPDYRNVCLFSELYELAPSTANSVFEIKQIAEREKQNLLAQNLSEEAKAATLEAIRVETEKSLLQILGTRLLSNYTQSSGQWVARLSAGTAP